MESDARFCDVSEHIYMFVIVLAERRLWGAVGIFVSEPANS